MGGFLLCFVANLGTVCMWIQAAVPLGVLQKSWIAKDTESRGCDEVLARSVIGSPLVWLVSKTWYTSLERILEETRYWSLRLHDGGTQPRLHMHFAGEAGSLIVVRKEPSINGRALGIQRKRKPELIEPVKDAFWNSVVHNPGRTLTCFNSQTTYQSRRRRRQRRQLFRRRHYALACFSRHTLSLSSACHFSLRLLLLLKRNIDHHHTSTGNTTRNKPVLQFGMELMMRKC
jgi:hypothetical protein